MQALPSSLLHVSVSALPTRVTADGALELAWGARDGQARRLRSALPRMSCAGC
jgi:hypothetical protein